MRSRLLLAILLTGLAPAAYADAYRCQGNNGQTVFSDEPCGDGAERIELEAAPTTETINPPSDPGQPPQGDDGPDASEASTTDDEGVAPGNPCLATDADKKVMQAGTPEDEIRNACGQPTSVTTDTELFDRKLHYRRGDRSIEIFIRDGKKVGHGTR